MEENPYEAPKIPGEAQAVPASLLLFIAIVFACAVAWCALKRADPPKRDPPGGGVSPITAEDRNRAAWRTMMRPAPSDGYESHAGENSPHGCYDGQGDGPPVEF